MIVRHRGWAVAVLVATLGLGCHAAKDDPEGQAEELADPVRRENAIFNLKLPMKKRLAAVNECIELIRKSLSSHGLTFSIQAKNLYHDREEITVCILCS